MKKKTRYILILLGILLFAAGFGGGYFMHKYLAGGTLGEQYAYEALDEDYSLADYDSFLADYPQSPRVAEVKQRREKVRAMLEEWKQLEEIGTIGDFLNFKANFNETRFNRLCDLKIDSLEWANALKANTETAYEVYMRKHPDGTYAAEASVALDLIRRAQREAYMRRQAEADTTATDDEQPQNLITP